jgi:hypothetical protein
VDLAKVLESDNAARYAFENVSGQLIDDRACGELLPPALGLAVIHHPFAPAQASGGAEIQHPASSRRSNTMAALQSGQKVTDRGTPPTVSLTMSRHVRIWIG